MKQSTFTSTVRANTRIGLRRDADSRRFETYGAAALSDTELSL